MVWEPLLDAVYLVAAVAGTVGLSFATYLLSYKLSGLGSHQQHREMASSMIFRIGALHGLILALVFAQEMATYQRLEVQVAQEASAVADVFNDAQRYGGEAADPLRKLLVTYVREVVDSEWRSLGETRDLDGEAWLAWEQSYERVLDLTPSSPRQDNLRDQMLASLHAVAASRDMRESEASNSFANLFWFAALTGVVLIAACHYTYPPERHNLVLLGLFSAYTGVILFLIFAFSNPYSPPFALSPAVLENLLNVMMVEMQNI